MLGGAAVADQADGDFEGALSNRSAEVDGLGDRTAPALGMVEHGLEQDGGGRPAERAGHVPVVGAGGAGVAAGRQGPQLSGPIQGVKRFHDIRHD
jgi:hypothetical protein